MDKGYSASKFGHIVEGDPGKGSVKAANWLHHVNTKNQVIAIPEIYKGSVNTAMIRVSEVFRDAIRENCPAIVVVHNHPSGNPAPSAQDIEVTSRIVEAGQMLDIEVLDHIVIGHSGDNGFVSMKEQGLGFS